MGQAIFPKRQRRGEDGGREGFAADVYRVGHWIFFVRRMLSL
jgi:hypothetical protein